MSAVVLVAHSDGVRTLTLNRPETLNALTLERRLRAWEEIERRTRELPRVILPRFERRLCRRNRFCGEVRRGPSRLLSTS